MAAPAKKQSSDKQRILTPTFRVSYPHLFKPTQFEGKGDMKYSVTMLFPKTADLTVIKTAMKEAKISEFGANQAAWPKNLVNPVSDGDSPQFEEREGYKGHWVIKASSREDAKPGLVDYPACDPILDQAAFYPGCFARAQVFARVWTFGGKQGIQFILDHVQKMDDGPAFGGRKSAKEAFAPHGGAAVEDEADEASMNF